jgi:hypothetical protein
MAVLQYSQEAIDKMDALNQAAKSLGTNELIINVNSVLDHLNDPIAGRTILQMRELLTYLLEQINELNPPIEMRKTILMELAHFKANKKKNELSARYQRRKRGNEPIGQANVRSTIPPDAKAFYQNDLSRIEAELQRQATATQAQTNTSAAPNYNADGVKRHLPTLDELNKIPDTFL